MASFLNTYGKKKVSGNSMGSLAPVAGAQKLLANTQNTFAQAPAAGGDASYGGGGGGGGYASAVAPAPAPRISDDDWLGQDSQYKSSLSALEQKLREFEVENTSTRTKGTADYETSLNRLGWMKGAEGAGGDWNRDDRTTSFGNSYQGQMGDFASRGLLQSSLYDQANTDLLGNFNKQKADYDTSQTNFLEELGRALAGKKTDTQLGRDQARVEALARRAAGESGI